MQKDDKSHAHEIKIKDALNPKSQIKIALCQINTKIGAFNENIKKILNVLESLRDVDIALFPELVLSSYCPLDLLLRDDFIEESKQAIIELQNEISKLKTKPKFCVVGTVLESQKQIGRRLTNSAIVIDEQGKIVFAYNKVHLPSYDVFDETRYFEPSKLEDLKLWDSPFGKIAITICEDIWSNIEFGHKKIYDNELSDFVKNANLILNLSASPFEFKKIKLRLQTVCDFAKKANLPLFYVNSVGANDEILFDGGSLVVNNTGESAFNLEFFKEQVLVVDYDLNLKTFKNSSIKNINFNHSVSSSTSSNYLNRLENLDKILSKNFYKEENLMPLIFKALVYGIEDYFKKTNFSKAVIGLSGGIDSAVVATLATFALGSENVIGVAMPGPYSSSHSVTDAEVLSQNLGIKFLFHPIKFLYASTLKELESSFHGKDKDITEENLQSRLRALLLLAIANKENALVLSTGNKSELAVGYCTIYGDMAGALAPIGDLYKTQVYELARFINTIKELIPESTLKKPPSAELALNQTDEASLGSYDKLDKLLEYYLEEGFKTHVSLKKLVELGFEESYVKKILKLVKTSEFKRRQAAIVLKVSSKAFGIGRRIPIAK
jgi:NAD+ synthase (glutamine-hydrolysing)